MDEISELVYVSDVKTYELLFINAAGRKIFGENLTGRKCYEVLQGKNAPCEFCTSMLLKPDRFYTWERWNPISKKHFVLRDKLVTWAGRDARLEIAMDVTQQMEQSRTLQSALEVEMLILQCVTDLHETKDISGSIQSVLEKLGTFMEAERVYVFETHDGLMDNTYEWCAPGVKPMKGALQGLDVRLIDSWRDSFKRKKCMIIEEIEAYKACDAAAYKVLKRQNIRRLAAVPLELDGVLAGYIGADNPPKAKLRAITPIFRTLGYFLVSTMQRLEVESLLRKLSYYDTMTDFFNRNRFILDIQGKKGVSSENGGVVYIDVNGLKLINDRYGHKRGDEVLIQAAAKIRSVFEAFEKYRVGGDEFVVICRKIATVDFEDKVQELRRLFAQDDGCSASVGCKWSERFQAQRLIAEADERMYEDKKNYYRGNPVTGRYRHYND